MAMRATAAAVAASLRAAGVPMSGGGRVPLHGGGGVFSGLVYGHQATRFQDAPARVRAVEAAARGGGTRSFFSFGKGRTNLTSRIAEGPIKNEQGLLENSTDSTQDWKVAQLKLELNVEKALNRQRMEYETKLADVKKDFDSRVADLKKDYETKLADVKEDYDDKINSIKARQDKCFTDVKLLSQDYHIYKESFHVQVQNAQYGVIKAVGTVLTMVAGGTMSYFKLVEHVKLPTSSFQVVKGNPLWRDLIVKDWFE